MASVSAVVVPPGKVYLITLSEVKKNDIRVLSAVTCGLFNYLGEFPK